MNPWKDKESVVRNYDSLKSYEGSFVPYERSLVPSASYLRAKGHPIAPPLPLPKFGVRLETPKQNYAFLPHQILHTDEVQGSQAPSQSKNKRGSSPA